MQYNCNILLLNVSSKEHTYITDTYNKLYVCIYIYMRVIKCDKILKLIWVKGMWEFSVLLQFFRKFEIILQNYSKLFLKIISE